jgi:hypothetical protein
MRKKSYNSTLANLGAQISFRPIVLRKRSGENEPGGSDDDRPHRTLGRNNVDSLRAMRPVL